MSGHVFGVVDDCVRCLHCEILPSRAKSDFCDSEVL